MVSHKAVIKMLVKDTVILRLAKGRSIPHPSLTSVVTTLHVVAVRVRVSVH